MFSTKRHVLQLVSLLYKAGIRDFILCPGSRNIPLVQTIASVGTFHCLSVTDERSAGFYAIGQMQACGRPVAVCCTSGSAVLNLHPAVCEAFYQQLPLLLITADRPQAWIGQMDGQTLPQAEAYGPLIRKTVVLPEIKDEVEEWYCNRLINEALYCLESPTPGPVQIDVPITEPFFDFSETTLPDERLVKHFQAMTTAVRSSLLTTLNRSQRPLLIIGQRSYREENIDALMQLCRDRGIPVLCEHLANIPTPSTHQHFDELLAVEQVAKDALLRPDLVLCCGGHIVSKRLKHWLRANPPQEQWWLTPDDSMPDTFQHLTATIQCPSPYRFLQEALKQLAPSDKKQAYADRWTELEKQLTMIKETTEQEDAFCDIHVLRDFAKQLCNRSLPMASIQVANSSMVRNLQLFSLPAGVRTLCNRGVNGIEGSLSAAVGYALADKGLTFCLIGDLSFFYDMNALWHTPVPSNLRILLLNNGNGQIFHQLPHLHSPYLKDYFSAAHHFHAEGWAREAGLSYLRCDDYAALEQAWPFFFASTSEKPVLLEVFTDPAINERIYKAYYNQLKQIQL